MKAILNVRLRFWKRGGGGWGFNVRILPVTRIIRRSSEKRVRIVVPTVQIERIDVK